MQKQSFAHLVATLGPLVAAVLAFLGYLGPHHALTYCVCLLCFWKRAAIEDVVSSLQGAVSQTVTQAPVPAPAPVVAKSKLASLVEEAKAELIAKKQASDAAAAEYNAGVLAVATLKG